MKNFLTSVLSNESVKVYCILALSLAICLLGNLYAPNFIQKFWCMGYAESLANSRLFSVYAETITVAPSPIAFGLPHVYLMSFLVRTGIDAYYAYDLVFAFWILLSFYSSYKICCFLNIDEKLSAILPVFLLTHPAILEHHSYSVLGIGYMLIPFYVYTALVLFKAQGLKQKLASASLFVLMCTLALFNDGYSFIMTMMIIGGLYITFFNKDNWRGHLLCNSVIIALAIIIAYVLYSVFIKKNGWEHYPRNAYNVFQAFFTSYILPVKGSWSILGEYFFYKHPFPENYTQNCYFCIPLLVVNIVLLFSAGRKLFSKWQYWLMWGMILISVWLSLGPDIALTNNKTIPSGNWFIYKYLPGFKVMRATARWGILVNILLIGIFYVSLGASDLKKKTLVTIFCIVYFFNFLPSPFSIKTMINAYRNEKHIRNNLEKDLRGKIKPHETVLFIPFRNNFSHLYWGSVNKANTWNTGCDKNVSMLCDRLPSEILPLTHHIFETQMESHLNEINACDIVDILLCTAVDVVIFDYNSCCPIAIPPFNNLMKNDAVKLETYLLATGCIDIEHSLHFSYYRLNKVGKRYKSVSLKEKKTFTNKQRIKIITTHSMQKIDLGRLVKINSIPQYSKGFYQFEETGRWAGTNCNLFLPLSTSVDDKLEFIFRGWPVSSNQTVIIRNYKGDVLKNLSVPQKGKYSIPITPDDIFQNTLFLFFEFPNACQPSNGDHRKLSFFFFDIKLSPVKPQQDILL